MNLFCDLDGVLVFQTGRDRFDTMPWMPDGRALWTFIAPFKPIILTALRDDIYDKCAEQKMEWCDRELGADVPRLIVKHSIGKAPNADPGDILIDDDQTANRLAWQMAGGVFIHHRSVPETISMLKLLGIGNKSGVST